MNRTEFLNTQFPLPAYCEAHRGPSTQFAESFHIKNSNTNMQLNFWWRCDDTITVCLFDGKEKNPYKKYSTLVNTQKELKKEELIKLTNQYLK